MGNTVFRRAVLLCFKRNWNTVGTIVSAIALAAVLFASPISYSQQLTQYAHTAWRLQDGVFEASPISLTQTADGFLWVGTMNGLVRFDGVHFESWNDRLHERHACCAFSLLGSKDGSLWIGMQPGLARLKDGQFTVIASDARHNNLIEDHTGRIWVTRGRVRDGKGPLCEIQGAQLQCQARREGFDCRSGEGLAEDKNGTIWVGDDTGKVCNWNDGVVETLSAPAREVACAESARSLLANGDGSILVGCMGGVERLERSRFAPFRSAALDGSKLKQAKLLYSRDGSLWIGTTNDGLYRITNGATDHFNEADGLSDDNVAALYEDHEGNIWVATANGLDRFHRLSVVSFSSKQGLLGTDDAALLASRDGHTLWVSGEQGLTAIRDGKITTMTRNEGLPGLQVSALFEDTRGVLWMDIDFDLFSYANGHFTKHVRNDGKPTEMVVGIAQDFNGFIWLVIAGKDRLLRLDPNTGVAQVVKPQEPSRIASSPKRKVYLALYLSGEISVIHEDNSFETISLPSGPRSVRGLLAYDEKALFVATTVGLYRWEDHKWSSLTTKNGLPCDSVQELVNDEDGNLWLHSTCGYARLSKQDVDAWSGDPNIHLSLRLYDAFDGARPGRGNFDSGHARTANGQLWFANGSVLQMIDPKNLADNQIPPPVHILRVVADHKTFGQLASVSLPPLTHDLEIDYAGLSLVSPEKVQFRYRLSGADKEWQDVGARREAYYTGLRPGHYRFQVLASNNSGVWNLQGDTLEFSIAPAWYQRNWFRVACAVTFLAMIWGIYELRVRQLARQFNLRLEERLAERARIARDLHDTLLQSFQGLLFRLQAVLIQIPTHPEKACETLEGALVSAEQAIAEGRTAVQELRSGSEGTLEKALIDHTRELAASQNGAGPTVRVIVEGERRSKRPVVRDEVQRIARELLRNAYQHAQAQKVEAELRYEADAFLLIVRDDGKGIDPDVLKNRGRAGHWGLPGMYERAEGMGAHLDIWSKVGAGTEVRLRVPAAIAYEKSGDRVSGVVGKGNLVH